ncbi:unnamed protein product [Strongylus vulgaris]|uniref:DUF7083 domain-containing protein n=1 Tax=Strongylus vulgaris TaxID=40348 RepID=A0A3P7IWA4_STRVU|nr:unnamed protein product [Strongylus vulgaris]
MFATLSRSQDCAVHYANKDQNDQLTRDLPKFVSDKETGNTFTFCYKRYGPVIRDALPDKKKRDLILMKVDESAFRKYARIQVAGTRFEMIRQLDSHADDTPLTIQDLVNECENFTALKGQHRHGPTVISL